MGLGIIGVGVGNLDLVLFTEFVRLESFFFFILRVSFEELRRGFWEFFLIFIGGCGGFCSLC